MIGSITVSLVSYLPDWVYDATFPSLSPTNKFDSSWMTALLQVSTHTGWLKGQPKSDSWMSCEPLQTLPLLAINLSHQLGIGQTIIDHYWPLLPNHSPSCELWTYSINHTQQWLWRHPILLEQWARFDHPRRPSINRQHQWQQQQGWRTVVENDQ